MSPEVPVCHARIKAYTAPVAVCLYAFLQNLVLAGCLLEPIELWPAQSLQ